MKKIIPIIIVIVIIAAATLYFLVLRPEPVKKEVRIEYSPGEYFTTNVKSEGSALRLLKATIILVVNDEGLEEMLADNNARIRDTIIFILRDLRAEDILAEGTQDGLRERIITALNERLGIDNFVEVLFNDFVMA